MRDLQGISEILFAGSELAQVPDLVSQDTVDSFLLGMEQIMGKQLTSDGIDIWTRILHQEGVTEQEFRDASVTVAKSVRFMPKPAEVLEQVRLLRERSRAEQTRAYMASLVEAIDREGRLVMVPKDRLGEDFQVPPPLKPRKYSVRAQAILKKLGVLP